MRLWVKFTLIGVLLILSLSGTVYAASATLGAVHSFTVQQSLSKTGDVRAIRPWMTVPYVAHTCRIPTSYLYGSLGFKVRDKRFNHATLHVLALYSKRSDNAIVTSVQKAILYYRQQHRPLAQPTPTSKRSRQPPGRTAA